MATTTSTRTKAAKASKTTRDWESVNRVVFPTTKVEETLSLYALDWTQPHLNKSIISNPDRRRKVNLSGLSPIELSKTLHDAENGVGSVATANDFSITDRTTVAIHEGGHLSLCTYFNAFPASYWRRWTRVDVTRFTCQARGKGYITLMHSTGRGLATSVTVLEVNSASRKSTFTFDIPMTGLLDGGFFWADAEAAEDVTLTLSDAQWQVPTDKRTAEPLSKRKQTSLSIAIATFNRPTYCFEQLSSLAAAEDLRKRIDTIYCTDQGTDLVSDQPGFAAMKKDLGAQLTLIRQRNLGGSGGFTRGMYETVNAGKSDYVLLLDDDAVNEPEAILRAVQFSDYAAKPVIVGGGMLHLDNRSVLYTQGERLNTSRMWMQPSRGLEYNHDFSQEPLRDAPELHQLIGADYNGWWECLIPVSVVKEIGLPMPVFIKFDDVEYSLRAKEHGYPTVCLPGVAVWHQAWHDKDPSRTWEQYFLHRNRWICALLHCPKPNPRFAMEMQYTDLTLGMRLLYSGMALHQKSLHDILRGPEYIISTMPTALGEARKLKEAYPDSQLEPSVDAFPEPVSDFSSKIKPKPMWAQQLAGLKAGIKALLTRSNGTNDERPQTTIPSYESMWESFEGVSSALVTSSDGNSVAWFKRNTPLYHRAMKESVQLSSYFMKHWEELSEQYRSYPFTDFSTWEKLFNED